MDAQSSTQGCREHCDATAPCTSTAEATNQPEQQLSFPLDVAPDDVAFMVRHRHASGDGDTQVRVFVGHEPLLSMASPAGYLVDAIDVIGTRWDGEAPGGIHRVVCLLARTPDEDSKLRLLIVVDDGDVIAIPSDDSDLRKLTGLRIVYARGRVLPLP